MVRQRWQRGTRFYEIETVTDLFGVNCVCLTYGRIGTAIGRRRTKPCADEVDAARVSAAVARRRIAHGYVLQPLSAPVALHRVLRERAGEEGR